MKRSIITLGLLIAAAFALTNCAQKESYAPVQEEAGEIVSFQFAANLPAETKTFHNGGLVTEWSAGDKVKLAYVFTAPLTGNQYTGVFSNPFTTTGYGTEGDGVFTGNIDLWKDGLSTAGSLAGVLKLSAVYPYTADGEAIVPMLTVQQGYNSMKHLAGKNCPLYGDVTIDLKDQTLSDLWNRKITIPRIQMQHATSIIELQVKNDTDAPIVIDTVGFRVGQELKGFTKVENPTELLKSDEPAKIYIVTEPFTAPAGEDIVFWVNNTPVKYGVENDVVFAPGKIKRVAFNYEKEAQERYILAESEVRLDADRIVPSIETLLDFEYLKQWVMNLKEHEDIEALLTNVLMLIAQGDIEGTYKLLGGIPGFEHQTISVYATEKHLEPVISSVSGLLDELTKDIENIDEVSDLISIIRKIEYFCNINGLTDAMKEYNTTLADYGLNLLEFFEKINLKWIIDLLGLRQTIEDFANTTIFDLVTKYLSDDDSWIVKTLNNYVLGKENIVNNLFRDYIIDAVKHFEDLFNAQQLEMRGWAISNAQAEAYAKAKTAAVEALKAINNEEVAKLDMSIWGLFRGILDKEETKAKFDEYQLGAVYNIFYEISEKIEEIVQYDQTKTDELSNTYQILYPSGLAQ